MVTRPLQIGIMRAKMGGGPSEIDLRMQVLPSTDETGNPPFGVPPLSGKIVFQNFSKPEVCPVAEAGAGAAVSPLPILRALQQP